MSYRFTETNKWDDDWFFELKPMEKLVWFYILDKCDNAGFYEIPIRKAAFEIGITEDIYLGAIKGLTRGLVGAKCGNRYFVKKFLKHQKNELLNANNNYHKQIINIIKTKCLNYDKNLAPSLGLNSPLVLGLGLGLGKGLDLGDKEKGSGEKENPKKGKNDSPEIVAAKKFIGNWFGRRELTKWSEKEMKALKKIMPIPDEDFDLMDKFYIADIPRDDFRRTSIQTLLNNWTGELDKARAWQKSKLTNWEKDNQKSIEEIF